MSLTGEDYASSNAFDKARFHDACIRGIVRSSLLAAREAPIEATPTVKSEDK